MMRTPMHVHLQRIAVAYDFPVVFTRGVFAPENDALRDAIVRREPTRRHRLLVLVEDTVAACLPTLVPAIESYAAHHASALVLAGEHPVVIAGGEDAKSDPAALTRLLDLLHRHRLDRHACLVIVGGGALLDLAGYAAATFHRGIRVVRIPTTVLAQADSGVSVKNGVNAWGQKNLLGTFAPPFAVVNDHALLATLPARELRAGMAEAVKVALIRDAAFFAWQEAHAEQLARGEDAALATLIRRTAELHLAHIAGAGDPFELGSARPLDFGHWAAHKLESLSAHRLRHGEAVAIGMALDTCYSVRAGLLTAAALETVLALLERLGFRLWDPTLAELGRDERPLVLEGLHEFREHLGGDLTITLLEAIGRGVEVHAMRPELIHACLDELRARDARR